MDNFYLLLAVTAAVVGFGCWRRCIDGKARSARGERLTAAELGAELGEVTLVQFSSSFCAPCRSARTVLGKVADAVPGVTHIEVDAESNLELVRRLDVLRTPTTLLLDRHGEVRNRVTGVPDTPQLLSAIATLKG